MWLLEWPKTHVSEGPFGNQHVEGSKTLLICARQHSYADSPLILNKFSCVSCLLVRSKFLGHFFNTLTTAHMYSCHYWQRLPQQIQTKLSSKPSTSSERFIEFWKSTSNFEHFEKKITFIASIRRKLLIPKNVFTWMP